MFRAHTCSMSWTLCIGIIYDVFLSWSRDFINALNELLEERNLNFQVFATIVRRALFACLLLIGLFHSFNSLLDFLDNENLVLVELLMHREFASLSESLGAALVGALERLLASVNVCMFFQILAKGESLVANHTDKWFWSLVSGDMSSQWESCGEFLVTVVVGAFVWSFHVCWILLSIG